MSKAEEFEQNGVRGETRYDLDRYEFAEAYHKQEVNAISDEEIKQESKYNSNKYNSICMNTSRLSFIDCAKWFKNKLLKK